MANKDYGVKQIGTVGIIKEFETLEEAMKFAESRNLVAKDMELLARYEAVAIS